MSLEKINAHSKDELWTLGLNTIKELETERGILASGKEEIYGCIFGRDSLITSLKLLKAFDKSGDIYFLGLVRKILVNLALLQGETSNIESGEEPGKIIHEYRPDGHEFLTKHHPSTEKPWYLYPDGKMRSYDSVDSTPLFLIAVARYRQASGDEEFYKEIKPHVERALGWLMQTAKSHKYGFISYQFHPERKFGGLVTQSWMDSFDSIFHEDGTPAVYPISTAEVQSYAYLAYRLWQHELQDKDAALSSQLELRAESLKYEFNRQFIYNGERLEIAFAIDGVGWPMLSPRSSMGHLLWSSIVNRNDGRIDSILEPVFVPKLVSRLLSPDLFEPQAGIRTLSKNSKKFDPQSYHNGSIWPHDTAMIAEGLENFGYESEARAVRDSLRRAWAHFQTPVELFAYTDEGFSEYLSPSGQKACAKQAWSAASMLAEL